MQTMLAFLIGFMVTVSVYMMLSRNIIRFLFALIIMGNAVNLLIFTCGRLTPTRPPLIPEGAVAPLGEVANALPQALVLTAIVIGFAMVSFILVLYYQTYQTMGTVDSESMRSAELEE